MSARLALAVAAAVLAVAGRPATAGAHDFNPGVLSLAEREPGRFDLAWTAPVDSAGSPAEVEPVFPPGCRRDAARLDCGGPGLAGPIWFTGMHLQRMVVVVVVRWRGGQRQEHLVSGAEPVVEIRAPARPGLLASARGIADHAAAIALALALLGALRGARAAPADADARRGALDRRAALAGALAVSLGALAAHLASLGSGAAAAQLASLGWGELASLAPGAAGARALLAPLAAAGAVLLARAALVGRGLGRAPAITAGGFGLVVGATCPWPVALAAALGAAWTARRAARSRAAPTAPAGAAAPSVLDRHGGPARLDRRMNQLAGALGAAALVHHALNLTPG